jgi:signal transduction histidine kinase
MALHDLPSAEVNRVHFVNRAIQNMKSVLDRCVQISRLDDHQFKLNCETVNLSSQVGKWLQDVESEFGFLSTRNPMDPDMVLSCDLQCLGIVVNNLLENAFKYSGPTKEVRISLNTAIHADGRSGCLLSVANRPTLGWPDREKIFTKYYRSSSAQRISGSGLGLYLSHNLAALMHGDLHYEPDEEWVRFSLWLPIV